MGYRAGHDTQYLWLWNGICYAVYFLTSPAKCHTFLQVSTNGTAGMLLLVAEYTMHLSMQHPNLTGNDFTKPHIEIGWLVASDLYAQRSS